jgi:hypothetical protein
MNHTPGPWTTECDELHYGTRSTVTAGGKTEKWPGVRMIVQVGGSSAPGEQEANTRLIAAAPDLLFALVNLLAVKRGEGGTKFNCDVIAEEAIAKATSSS